MSVQIIYFFFLWNCPKLLLSVPHCSLPNSDVIKCWNCKLSVAICSQLTYCELGLIWQKVHLYFPAPYHEGVFPAPSWLGFVGCGVWRHKWSTFLYVCIFFSSLLTTPTVFVDLKSAGTSLLWLVCVNTQQWVLMEALKPFVWLFSNGSVVSFALVQRTDPESFVCNWIPMQVLSYYPGTTSLLDGGPEVEMNNWIDESWMWSAQPCDWKGTMATWQIHNKLLVLFSSVSVKLSYTGLLGYLPVCSSYKCIAVLIRERQGYYCIKYFQLMWKDFQDYCSKNLPHPMSAPLWQQYICRKCFKVYAIECTCLC